MQLKHCEVIKSPGAQDRVRLVGEVAYDRGFARAERLWFEVPERYAEFLTDSGNPSLACLIPLAVTLGEPLRIDRQVDRQLYDNVQELMRIWKEWYPYLHIVPIEADTVEAEDRMTPGRTASFFSGGVDGFYTLLHFDASATPNLHDPIEDLIFVWGFDIPLRNHAGFTRTRYSLQRAAADLGKELVVFATNLRETRCQKADFSYLSHGSILASTVLTVGELYGEVMISSSISLEHLFPCGSHPQTDPLYSTKRTQFVHYGVETSRIEKTANVAQLDVALRSLRVCWLSESGGNCRECNKCSRTMITLAVYDALERYSALGGQPLDLEKVATIYSPLDIDIAHLRDIQAAALHAGKQDIADAIERSFQHTDRLNQSLLFTTLWKVKQWLPTQPALWRLLRPVRRVLKAFVRKTTGATF
jgi:hypothetical protein